MRGEKKRKQREEKSNTCTESKIISQLKFIRKYIYLFF